MKSWLVYGAYRLAAGMVGLLPEPVMRRLGTLAGRLAYRWGGRRREMARRHMRRVLGDVADLEVVAREVFASYGRYWAEVLWLRPRRLPAVLEHIHVDGLEFALAARDAGTGMIFALPHVGNWEVAGAIARREDIALVAAAEALANRRVVSWFVSLREQLGIGVVLADGSAGVMRRLRRFLQQGGAVALLTDRDLSGRGLPVSFFGEKTTLPVGAVGLALRSGAPILPVASYFAPGRGHHLVVGEPLPMPAEGPQEERLRQGMAVLAEALEEMVRVAPTQWHLLQPNWPSDRRQP